jgi:NhaP-type Na+/H+ or K+/H+ antiporter
MPDFKKILSYENVIKCLSYAILILLIWASLWSIVGEAAVPPNGSLFTLLVIFIISYLFGEIISLVDLPPLLGMLIAGFIIGNTFEINLNKKYSSILRSIALIIILLRAGLGLDPKVIRKLSAVCLRLSFIPCFIEALTISIATHLLLDFPLKWGFLLGFVLAAVTPAVVVPGMITLQENQLGTDKGIPTLVIAAASVDDVIAITGFGVCLGLVFDSGSSLVWSIFKGPVEVLIGVIYGIIIGVVLWFIPSKWDSYKNKSENVLRLNILLLSGIFSLFGSESLNLGGAGALGCLVSNCLQ